MNSSAWLGLWSMTVVGVTGATACTSAVADGGGTGGDASGPAGPASGTASGNPDATSTGAGGLDLGDQIVTLTMDSFEVPAGSEVYKCQNFANPFGDDVDVRAFESHMTPGSHHLLLFYKDGATDGSAEDCSGLEFAATPYSTQLPDDSVIFPDTVGALITKNKGLRLQSHYLNTTGQPITAHVEMKFHVANPGEVTQHAGVLFVVEPAIFVEPHATQTVTHDCHIPFDMNLLKVSSHMHKHGTNFDATIAGETVFETTQWSDPEPALFDPARVARANDALHFECTFENDGDTTLTFGESAESNEMCIFAGSFYPVPDDHVVTVDCN